MKRHFLLWASGRDRPGIVANIARALFRCGANLEDSSMMRLGSEFGMFVIFSVEESASATAIERDLRPTANRLRLAIGLKRLSHADSKFPSLKALLVSVHGPDRPGIVYRVTATLAEHGFNITDLSTHRTTSGSEPGYVLLIEGELKKAKSNSVLRKELQRLGDKLGTHIDVRPISAISL